MFLVPLVAAQTSMSQDSVELQLVQDLMTNYDVNARPVLDPGDAVAAEIGVALQQIVDLVSATWKISRIQKCSKPGNMYE